MRIVRISNLYTESGVNEDQAQIRFNKTERPPLEFENLKAITAPYANNHKHLSKLVNFLREGVTISQIKAYYDRFMSSKLRNKDIYFYKTFRDFEVAIDAVPTKIEKQLQDNKSPPIYEDAGVAIWKGDSPESCIQHGQGYDFCISRKGTGNLFYSYRTHEGLVFYFVRMKNRTDEGDTSEFTDPTHMVVIGVSPDNNYNITLADNGVQNGFTEDTTQEELLIDFPELESAFNNNVFQLKDLTEKEEEEIRLIESDADNEEFARFPYDIKLKYIKYGHFIYDKQWDMLDNTLKNEVINFCVHDISQYQKENIAGTSLEKLYHKVKSQQADIIFKQAQEYGTFMGMILTKDQEANLDPAKRQLYISEALKGKAELTEQQFLTLDEPSRQQYISNSTARQLSPILNYLSESQKVNCVMQTLLDPLTSHPRTIMNSIRKLTAETQLILAKTMWDSIHAELTIPDLWATYIKIMYDPGIQFWNAKITEFNNNAIKTKRQNPSAKPINESAQWRKVSDHAFNLMTNEQQQAYFNMLGISNQILSYEQFWDMPESKQKQYIYGQFSNYGNTKVINLGKKKPEREILSGMLLDIIMQLLKSKGSLTPTQVAGLNKYYLLIELDYRKKLAQLILEYNIPISENTMHFMKRNLAMWDRQDAKTASVKCRIFKIAK